VGDLATSRQLSKLAKEGAFTVLLNPQQAHAEQTIHEDFRLRDAEFQAKFPHRPIDPAKRKIAGTFIRCGACGGEIGPDEEQTHIHDESEPATAPHLRGQGAPHEPSKGAQGGGREEGRAGREADAAPALAQPVSGAGLRRGLNRKRLARRVHAVMQL